MKKEKEYICPKCGKKGVVIKDEGIGFAVHCAKCDRLLGTI